MLEFTLFIIIVSIIMYVKTTINTTSSTKKSFHKPYNENWKDTPTKSYQKTYKSQQEYKQQYNQVVGDLITTKEVARHFKTTQKNINQIFQELEWIEIKGKWILSTIKGNFNGARQKYNAQSKMKYVLWEDDILENEALTQKFKNQTKQNTEEKIYQERKRQETILKNPINCNHKTTHEEKINKGREYEEYVAKVYRSRGYHVSEYGKQQGVLDHGIDLIAKKEKEIVLIQCKNWNENGKWKIEHKDIKAFQTDARTFVEDKPLLRSCLLTARYTISGDFIHQSAIKHIDEMKKIGKRVDYEIVKMPIV